MRIESVTATAFGPLSGSTLQLAPGLTVIVGVNESAKSSWHAAIYAGLCGRKRGKGAMTLSDRRFAELHRPWGGDAWAASVIVVLDNGRRIEVSQDLAAKVDSRATDLDLARDVSSEILFEGSPDGAKWLGLDRYSFLATACINQAALLGVLQSADELQEYLGRAAASASADVTAARALELIDAFQKERVGRMAVNAIRPLKRATEALDKAQTARASAVQEHEDYLLLVEEADRSRQIAEEWTQQLAGTSQRASAVEGFVSATRRAQAARQDAERAQRGVVDSLAYVEAQGEQLDRIIELDAQFGGQPPAGLAEAEGVAAAVGGALAAWRAVPDAVALSGETAQALRAELARLPEPPAGDLKPDPLVVRTLSELATALDRLAENQRRRPSQNPIDHGEELTAAEAASPAFLRDLAGDLATADSLPCPSADEIACLAEAARQVRERAGQLRGQAEVAASQREPGVGPGRVPGALAAFAGAGVLAVVAVIALVMGSPVGAVAAGALAFASGVAGLLLRRRPAAMSATSSSRSEVATAWAAASHADRRAIAAEEAHKAAASAASTSASVHADVAARCLARGLPVDAGRLRQLAADVELLRAQRTDLDRWTADDESLSQSARDSERRLRDALSQRGMAAADDDRASVDDVVGAYERECAQRAEQAADAGRRPALLQRISDREAAESSFAQSIRMRQEAVQGLQSAAALIAVGGLSDSAEVNDDQVRDLVSTLDSWQLERGAKAEHLDEARARWQQLQALLGGASREDLVASHEKAESDHAVIVSRAVQLEEEASAAEFARIASAEPALLDPVAVADVQSVEHCLTDIRMELEKVRENAQEFSSAAERAEALRSERATRVLSVAEAEEAVAAAQSEMDRVNELSTTLQLTEEFLQQAQERVHRDIAPVLMGTLVEWLPRVTDGRYVDAIVDPASLEVQVRGSAGNWRHASRLSVGTSEQIYLLLRMALARHLAVTGETCPLLLDDVTVQADAARTVQILELLLSISETRQVVLFAQEPSVAEWATSRLNGEQHKVIELEQVPST